MFAAKNRPGVRILPDRMIGDRFSMSFTPGMAGEADDRSPKRARSSVAVPIRPRSRPRSLSVTGSSSMGALAGAAVAGLESDGVDGPASTRPAVSGSPSGSMPANRWSCFLMVAPSWTRGCRLGFCRPLRHLFRSLQPRRSKILGNPRIAGKRAAISSAMPCVSENRRENDASPRRKLRFACPLVLGYNGSVTCWGER